MRLTKERKMRVIEVVEDELYRQQRLHKHPTRVEAALIEELHDLVAVLRHSYEVK